MFIRHQNIVTPSRVQLRVESHPFSPCLLTLPWFQEADLDKASRNTPCPQTPVRQRLLPAWLGPSGCRSTRHSSLACPQQDPSAPHPHLCSTSAAALTICSVAKSCLTPCQASSQGTGAKALWVGFSLVPFPLIVCFLFTVALPP